MYAERTDRYSTIEKPEFKVLRVNFYNELENGFELIRSHPRIADDTTRFVSSFRSVDLTQPDGYGKQGYKSETTRHDRHVAVYKCCLHRAGFKAPANLRAKWSANKDVRDAISTNQDPTKGLALEDACVWWEKLWEVYKSASCFSQYKQQKQREWADDDLKALLVMLTRRRTSGGAADCAGFRILKEIVPQHTSTVQIAFDEDILTQLRAGRIVIVDLSLGDESVQRMYTERITRKIFQDSMRRFTQTLPNNFIQFTFEEAHNLFPKKEDKDLSQIYNRLAKEGAKLNLGLVYATQEVSSISSNILKATQNWFISHLNNDDEIKELRKYYDFSDFTDSLIRFSQETDKGFVRMKAYSNAFVIPVQVDQFPPEQT